MIDKSAPISVTWKVYRQSWVHTDHHRYKVLGLDHVSKPDVPIFRSGGLGINLKRKNRRRPSESDSGETIQGGTPVAARDANL